jgi:hypothetical protein
LVNRNTAVQRSGQQELQIIVIPIYLHWSNGYARFSSFMFYDLDLQLQVLSRDIIWILEEYPDYVGSNFDDAFGFFYCYDRVQQVPPEKILPLQYPTLSIK